MTEVCLRCGEVYRDADGPGPCRCRSPVPSDDGETAKYRLTDDWRRDEYMAALGVSLLRHRPWCDGDPCLCGHGTAEATDPRPELVQDAIDRYRAEHGGGTVGDFLRKLGLKIGG